MVNYIYEETKAKKIKPYGDGWEFWGMRKTNEEEVAVWRKERSQ